VVECCGEIGVPKPKRIPEAYPDNERINQSLPTAT